MKVSDITQYYSYRGGGVRRYIRTKRSCFARFNGMSHTLIVPGRRTHAWVTEKASTHVVRSPRVPGAPGYRYFLRDAHVHRILATARPDIIEAGDPYSGARLALAARRRLRVPAVLYYHSDFSQFSHMTRNPLLGSLLLLAGRGYYRRLLRRFDAVFVASPAMAERLGQIGISPVVCVPPGLDEDLFAPVAGAGVRLRARLGLPGDAVVLLFVGRLSPEKQVDLLFNATAELGRQLPQPGRRAHLLVVGHGPAHASLARIATGRADVTLQPFTGAGRALAGLYSAADVFVHAGRHETFGMAPLEAQFCGCRTVAVKDSGLPSGLILNGGEWADTFTGEALAAAVRRALSREPDRAAIREKAVSAFSSAHFHAGLRAAYEGVIARFNVRSAAS